ncbi:MAG: hypothetical protein ACTSW7_01225 [Candidatus Thorarchaeota archaeon]|nr:hypothetical protein [Thermoplasmatales archaeon]
MAPITPISPVADQTIGATNMSIIIDFDNNPALVRVNSILAWDDISGFQNFFTGGVISYDSKKRIYLDTPSNFTRDAVVPVHAEDDSVNELDYSFIAAIDQMTTTDDASHPDIIDIDGTNVFVGYEKRDPTSSAFGAITINMRKHDPNTSEVEVISGRLVGYGTNPVSGKLIMFININDIIYATEALASDLPVTLTDVSGLNDYAPVTPGVGLKGPVEITQFYSVKSTETDIIRTTPGVGRKYEFDKTPYKSANPVPEIISVDPIILRIPPPISEPELSAIKGYYVARVYLPTNTISGGFHYIAFPEGASFVDWEDEGKPFGVGYIIIGVYQFDEEHQEIEGPRSDVLVVPPFLGADLIRTTPGTGLHYSISITQYHVEVLEDGTDIIRTTPGVGRWSSVSVDGFGSKGIGS